MEIHWLIIAMITGVLAGAIIIWLISRVRIATLNERYITTQQDLTHARADLDQKNETISQLSQEIVRLETTLEHERKASNEKIGHP